VDHVRTSARAQAEDGRAPLDPCIYWCHKHHSPQPLHCTNFAKRTMRWPGSGTDDDNKKKTSDSWVDSLGSSDWRTMFTDPRTIIPSIALTVASVTVVRLYKTYLRRIPSVNHIKPSYFRRKGLFGQVTSVGDADNFRLYHTPGGRMAGWGWLPWKRVPTKRDGLSNQTVCCQLQSWSQTMAYTNMPSFANKTQLHIRIAGVDAPELAHWGREAQPYAKEAHEWLINLLLNRRVRTYIYRRDQYDRVVAQVYVRKWLVRKDVGLEMLKMGLATVYEAKSGAEFGTSEAKYRAAEDKAKAQQVGMWAKRSLLQKLSGGSPKAPETPREYKARHAAADKQKKAG
jgi:endonuclease YncB( thermonuclease family)